MAKAKKLPKKKGAKKKKVVRKTKGVSDASPETELNLQLPLRPLKKGDPSKQRAVRKRRVSDAEKAKRLQNFQLALARLCEHLDALDGLSPLAARSELAISCVHVIEKLGHNVSIERPNI